jgi:hypothetical protein
MTNGSLRGCQKLRLDIGFGFRLSGCLRQTLCGCEIFQVCLGGLLFFFMEMQYLHDASIRLSVVFTVSKAPLNKRHSDCIPK